MTNVTRNHGDGRTCYQAGERPSSSQLSFKFYHIPDNVRFCNDVSGEECEKCNFSTYDHCIGFIFPDPNYLLLLNQEAYHKVCLKDYERLHPGTIEKIKHY